MRRNNKKDEDIKENTQGRIVEDISSDNSPAAGVLVEAAEE
jgi:hypothetical protein